MSKERGSLIVKNLQGKTAVPLSWRVYSSFIWFSDPRLYCLGSVSQLSPALFPATAVMFSIKQLKSQLFLSGLT